MSKKLIAVLLTLVMALALVACGKDEESETAETDPAVGTWYANEMTENGSTISMADYAEECGYSYIQIVLVLKEDGSLELTTDADGGSNTMEGTWTKESGEYSITYAEVTFSAYLDGDELHLCDENDNEIIMSQTAIDEEPTVDTESVVGTWNASELTEDGVSYDTESYAEYKNYSVFEVVLILKEDGTLELSSNVDGGANTMEGTWETTDDGYTISYGDEVFSAYTEDGKLYMEDNSGNELVFEAE